MNVVLLWKVLLLPKLSEGQVTSCEYSRVLQRTLMSQHCFAFFKSQSLYLVVSFRFSKGMSVTHFGWLIGWLWLTVNTFPQIPSYGLTAVNDMLSSAACLRGLSLVHKSSGDLHTYMEAMKVLLSSVRCSLHSVHVLTNAWGSYKQ